MQTTVLIKQYTYIDKVDFQGPTEDFVMGRRNIIYSGKMGAIASIRTANGEGNGPLF